MVPMTYDLDLGLRRISASAHQRINRSRDERIKRAMWVQLGAHGLCDADVTMVYCLFRQVL